MESLLQGGLGVLEVTVAETSSALGRSLAEAGLLKPGGAQLLALRRRSGELYVSPDPNLALEAEDILIVLGSEQQLQATALRLE
jgi:K+/H+ antiporter YhaU regulatory subunit KhtT